MAAAGSTPPPPDVTQGDRGGSGRNSKPPPALRLLPGLRRLLLRRCRNLLAAGTHESAFHLLDVSADAVTDIRSHIPLGHAIENADVAGDLEFAAQDLETPAAGRGEELVDDTLVRELVGDRVAHFGRIDDALRDRRCGVGK